MEIGEVFEGKVTGITKYGCFVAFGENKSGMVHISEVSNTFVNDINDVVKIDQEVKVKIIKIDENGRVNLSIKKAEPRPARQPQQRRDEVQHYTPKKKVVDMSELSFEDKMKMFMTNSQERLTDVKHNNEKKTGARRRK
ncbi:MAG: S1 RNA-binding domain-containing protein [Clostridia bacterium]